MSTISGTTWYREGDIVVREYILLGECVKFNRKSLESRKKNIIKNKKTYHTPEAYNKDLEDTCYGLSLFDDDE